MASWPFAETGVSRERRQEAVCSSIPSLWVHSQQIPVITKPNFNAPTEGDSDCSYRRGEVPMSSAVAVPLEMMRQLEDG